MNNANLKKMEIPVASFTELTVKWYDLQPIVNKKKGMKIHILVKCAHLIIKQLLLQIQQLILQLLK